MIDCIQQRNPGAGFINQHSRFCHYCEEDATYHYNVGHACGNVCETHAHEKDQRGKRVLRGDVEEGIHVPQNS